MISLKESPLYISRLNKSHCGNTLPHRGNHIHNSSPLLYTGMLLQLKHHGGTTFTHTLYILFHIRIIYIIPWEQSVASHALTKYDATGFINLPTSCNHCL